MTLDCRNCICYNESYPLKCSLDMGYSSDTNARECPMYLRKDDLVKIVQEMCPDGIFKERYIMSEDEINAFLKGGNR